MLPVVDPGAVSGGSFPGSTGPQVGFPEWPGPALPGPRGVYRTAGLAIRLTHQELAVAVCELVQTKALAHPAGMLLGESLWRHAEQLGDGTDFLPVNPDVAGRPATTVATALAGEVKAGSVPAKGGGGFRHAVFPKPEEARTRQRALSPWRL
jgi:hypothetical protein